MSGVVVVAVQVVGLVLVLAAFMAAQARKVRDDALVYLAVPAVGSAGLAVVAGVGHDWVFLVLEGTWAVVSVVRLARRPWRTGHPAAPSAPASTTPSSSTPSTGPSTTAASTPSGTSSMSGTPPLMMPLPAWRAVELAGDELSSPARLIHLFRDTYAAAQGRQWLQPHIVWWIALFLRDHHIHPNWTVLDSPGLADRVTSLGLPAGHTTVHPAEQTQLNFRLWWPLVRDLIHQAHHAHQTAPLPTTEDLDTRAWQLGLRPWMSSSTYEEIAGIGRALAVINHHHQLHTDTDHFLTDVVLPGLLATELHWLHHGRPTTHTTDTSGGTDTSGRTDVVLWRRHHAALTKHTHGRYLTPLDHLYLRAGDILHTLPTHTPNPAAHPTLTTLLDLHHQLHNHASPAPGTAVGTTVPSRHAESAHIGAGGPTSDGTS